MENTTKKTKTMYYEELRELVANAEVENQDEMLEFIDKQIAAIDKRKAAAAERAEKKRAESDQLTEDIYEVLGEELMTVDEILEALDNEELTRNKVTARLTKLINAGRAVKESMNVDGARKMAYKLAE